MQPLEEEDLLQGKFEAAQRMPELEEEELLQGKFQPVQRQGRLHRPVQQLLADELDLEAHPLDLRLPREAVDEGCWCDDGR